MLCAHARFASDPDGRPPTKQALSHLVDYINRLAQADHWDVTRCVDRVQQMMFADHSELVEMAELSGFVFVEASVQQMVLSADPQPSRSADQSLSDFKLVSGQYVNQINLTIL